MVKSSVYLSCSLTEDSIDEGHDGRLEADLVSVAACAPVQVVQKGLCEKQRRFKNEKGERHFNISFINLIKWYQLMYVSMKCSY